MNTDMDLRPGGHMQFMVRVGGAVRSAMRFEDVSLSLSLLLHWFPD